MNQAMPLLPGSFTLIAGVKPGVNHTHLLDLQKCEAACKAVYAGSIPTPASTRECSRRTEYRGFVAAQRQAGRAHAATALHSDSVPLYPEDPFERIEVSIRCKDGVAATRSDCADEEVGVGALHSSTTALVEESRSLLMILGLQNQIGKRSQFSSKALVLPVDSNA